MPYIFMHVQWHAIKVSCSHFYPMIFKTCLVGGFFLRRTNEISPTTQKTFKNFKMTCVTFAYNVELWNLKFKSKIKLPLTLIRPLCGYQYFWPCDLDLGVWPNYLKILILLISFEQWVLEPWYLTWVFFMIRPFCEYHYFLPCDLDLGVWLIFKKL